MCCEDTPAAPRESQFEKTLAEIMKERQAAGRKFEPLEDQLIGEVQQFGSQGYMQEQTGKAAATADASADLAGAASDRGMASMGINPNSGAFASRNRQLTLGRSLGRIGAVENARDSTRRLAYDALAGVSGRGDAKVGQAISAAGQGGQLYNQSVQNQMSQQNSKDSAMGGIGQLAGTVGTMAMFMSSRKAKHNIKPVEGKAIKAIRKMPAREWSYKGQSDRHVGPMAEDAKKAMGGNGVTINVADVAGTALAATQNIDKRLRRLEKR
jgi:hypothetical protein